MPVVLASNSYGKSSVRLLKVVRDGRRHDIRDMTVDIALEGEFGRAHTHGDNSDVLPTDTMKNTVYAKAAESKLAEPEQFASELAAHFLDACHAAATATVSIAEHGWRRLDADKGSHDHAFERGSGEMRTVRVSSARKGATTIVSGIRDLVILKSARSAFTGYPKDRYTTLPETEDRILATSMTAQWRYTPDAGLASRFGALHAAVRRSLLAAFAGHDSKSVQHTLYAMGEAVLAESKEVEEISITMPNKHHLPVDVERFGITNANEIFLPTPEPYGLIEATLRRGAAKESGRPPR
jgi:urate oxidase